MELLDLLIESGLSEKEAAVYLAACELGPAGAQEIANKSGVHRTTAYLCLETLTQQSYISTAEAGGRTVFVASPPDALLEHLRRERLSAADREERLSDALPRLLALYNVEGRKPQVLFMEGKEGLRSQHGVFENLKGPYVQITNFDDAADAFRGLEITRSEHHERLREAGTQGRSLLVTHRMPDEVKLARLPVDTKILPYEKFPIHGEVIVREDTVLLFSYKVSVFMTIVRSKTMADAVRALFELAWLGAKDFPSRSAADRMAQPIE